MNTSRAAQNPFAGQIATNSAARSTALYWSTGLTREPSIGAHLATPRDRYVHHGIYVGRAQVIHYAGFSRGWQAGPIEEVTLVEFAFGRALRVVDHPDARYSAGEIVQRARTRLGEYAFHLLRNNCEHFCNWCISGRHYSEQVEDLGPLASLLLHCSLCRWDDRRARRTPDCQRATDVPGSQYAGIISS